MSSWLTILLHDESLKKKRRKDEAILLWHMVEMLGDTEHSAKPFTTTINEWHPQAMLPTLRNEHNP